MNLLPLILCFFFTLSASATFSQTTPPEGIRKQTPSVHAFTNCKIIPSPGKGLEKGILVIRDGIIEAVGKEGKIPEDARVWDLRGMWIYPGFIESYSELGMPREPEPKKESDSQFPITSYQLPVRGAPHWNPNVLPHQEGIELFFPDTNRAKSMREQGFTSSLSVPAKGIFKGMSLLVNLGEGKASELVVQPRVAQHLSLKPSREDDYPNSLMGVIALIRQTFYDADWYEKSLLAYEKNPRLKRPERNTALEALVGARRDVPLLFVMEASDEFNFLRANEIAKEFSIPLILLGSGREYKRLEAIRKTGRGVILPVKFPDPPSVEIPEDALQLTLQELRHWDEAPENPGRLEKAGIPFAFTSWGLKDEGKFLEEMRKAVERGLSREGALRAMTMTPALFFGVEDKLGSLETGKIANFVVTDGDLFEKKTKIREVWIDGKRYEVNPLPLVDVRGEWTLHMDEKDSIALSLKGEIDGLKGSVTKGKKVDLTKIEILRTKLILVFKGDSLGFPGVIRMTGDAKESEIFGSGEWGDGSPFIWSGTRTLSFTPEPDTTKPEPIQMASFPPVFPFGEFGRSKPPEQPEKVLLKNATIWTCGPEGTIEEGDLLIEKGKILKVGKNLPLARGALEIDGKGKHVTPGIIDCHSHIAISGNVNESGQAVSAEVQIGDVIDSDDISIYRQLAGGVTTSNIFHGSANPIGGQNQVIKLRWGLTPEEMRFEGAPSGIKFALGENVKQSNWGDRYKTRYPQTRMGVEQLMRDEFRAALDYEKSWKEYDKGRSLPPRRDLELDVILEILKGKRLVHCHAYRQDEILAMMRVAEDFGFRIRTFQHNLEGYKVADVMARHGAGGSSFSDWWAYKIEVYDAIPYNAVLMHDQGVVTSFNSDSDELARRLNLEAAKAVKYGGVPDEEALKFVTLNPAKQLMIDDRVGSLESGKDADFVIWSGPPLSTYTICEETWVDGRRYFDLKEDRRMREEIQKERAVLIQKILAQKKQEEGKGKKERKWN